MILTNGDSAVEKLTLAGVASHDEIHPWRDVLHEGPIVLDGGAEAFCEARATYLAEAGFGSMAEIKTGMMQSHQLIVAHGGYEEVELWFEHDLYDQLQLIQILALLSDHARLDGVSLVQTSNYIGEMTSTELQEAAGHGAPITMAQLEASRRLWSALGASTPKEVFALSQEFLPTLPFVQPALERFLQELPGRNGLGRVQNIILDLLSISPTTAGRLFGQYCEQEEPRYLGDTSFFKLLEKLQFCEKPVVQGLAGPFPSYLDGEALRDWVRAEVSLTDHGIAILGGADFAQHNTIDFWWSGTRISNNNMWRFADGELWRD
ncbi:MAG: DUF1835 domain-containing protein [Pseudomonadota bacterium]